MTTSLQQEASAAELAGTFDLYAAEESDAMLAELDERTTEGWLAAIILPRRWEDNLYMRADAG